MILPSVRPLNQALNNNCHHNIISIFVHISSKMYTPIFPVIIPLPHVPCHYIHFSHYTLPPMFHVIIPTSAIIPSPQCSLSSYPLQPLYPPPNVPSHYTHFSHYTPSMSHSLYSKSNNTPVLNHKWVELQTIILCWWHENKLLHNTSRINHNILTIKATAVILTARDSWGNSLYMSIANNTGMSYPDFWSCRLLHSNLNNWNALSWSVSTFQIDHDDETMDYYDYRWWLTTLMIRPWTIMIIDDCWPLSWSDHEP